MLLSTIVEKLKAIKRLEADQSLTIFSKEYRVTKVTVGYWKQIGKILNNDVSSKYRLILRENQWREQNMKKSMDMVYSKKKKLVSEPILRKH